MVESQIRPNGVRDPSLLDAFAVIPRELFVRPDQKPLAYMDGAIAVVPAKGDRPARALLPPMILAKMLELAAPQLHERALDVGGVTGYSAAILARLCKDVHALETDDVLAADMKKRLEAVAAGSVRVHAGPLEKGVDEAKPFDVVILNGAVAEEPEGLFPQLAEGGRLLAIVRKGWLGRAFLFTKNAGAVSGRPVFDAGADVLPGFEVKPQFVF